MGEREKEREREINCKSDWLKKKSKMEPLLENKRFNISFFNVLLMLVAVYIYNFVLKCILFTF